MRLFSLVLLISLVACDNIQTPVGRIEFVEKIENCPLESYGSRKFCSIRVDHPCHKICVEHPSCCDLTEKLEKHI